MASIGESLKNKRLEKKLSLEEISKRTKVQKKVLEALEQDKAEEMLGPVYAKSFLKKYSLFLGLKTSSVLDKTSAAKSSAPFILDIASQKRKDKDWQKIISLAKNIVLISVIIIITVVASARMVRLVYTKATTSSKAKVEKSTKSSAASGVTEKKATPPHTSSAKVTPSRLLLKTKRDVWAQIKVDQHIAFEGILKKASQEEWAFKKEMRLWVGNGAFVELTLNGKYYGSPGRGVIKNIIVTENGIKVKK